MNYRHTLIAALLIVGALCSRLSFAEIVEKKGYHYDINKEEKVGRTRQTLWGECTDANLKTVAKRYMIEKK